MLSYSGKLRLVMCVDSARYWDFSTPRDRSHKVNYHRSCNGLRGGAPIANFSLERCLGAGGQVLKNSKDVTHDIAELIRLHDDVLARVFALQTLLQDLGVLSPEKLQQRTEELKKRFALDLETRLGKSDLEQNPR